MVIKKKKYIVKSVFTGLLAVTLIVSMLPITMMITSAAIIEKTTFDNEDAGNESIKDIDFKTDKTAPKIQVIYDNNEPCKMIDGHGYFNNNRTATVVITERTTDFDEDAATEGIKITAVDAKGKTPADDDGNPLLDSEGNRIFDDEGKLINLRAMISSWDTVEGTAPDDAIHTATISYNIDANYTFLISYKDNAGNECEFADVTYGEGTVAPTDFTVDKTAPTGIVKVGELGFWDKLIEILTFGLWSKDTVTVSGSFDDATSFIEDVSYYKTDKTTALTRRELEELADNEWKEFNSFDVPANEQFVVYVRIVDFTGNTEYSGTDGIIVDNVKPEISFSMVGDDINGFYNSDVSIAIKVVDPVIEGVYSGLKEITYEIFNMGEKTQEGTLYKFEVKEDEYITQGKLLQVWDSKVAVKYITVDSELNNSNEVEIRIYAVDNAGNKNKDAISLKIDVTNPVISVSYDNNDGDTAFADSTYFKTDRTATIVIAERNFNPDNVKVTITNEHEVIPLLSGWKTAGGDGNNDNTIHTATITYDADGDYTFDITYMDEAGNNNDAVNYGESLAPQKFTIDKTLPVVSITYDNNDALNGKYYKAGRIATLVVTEHNFETSRIKITLNASDNGQQAILPAVSNWSSNGDVHTATITYTADAFYTFDFDYQDKAGNATADIAEQTFYVDKTNPIVSITKIVDQSANNDEGSIGFVITATDTNLDIFTPILTAVVKNGDNFENKQLGNGAVTDTANGKIYAVENLESDGIYHITCTVVDKAGNAYSQVMLQREDGSSYVENRSGNDTLITFSVNRNGSTYEVKENTVDLVKKYYVQNVTENVTVIETNVDPLQEYKVTLNEKELTENEDYTVTQTGGDGTWIKYTYVISKSLFETEGEYKIVISSKDKAANNAFSDVKDASINFIVDRTAPIVAVTGLTENGRYQAKKQIVTLIPTDNGGALNSLIVCLVDENGEKIKELIHLSGEALEEAMETGAGKITFEMEEGLHQNVQIICNDCAVDEEGTTNTYNEIFKNISVSSSTFVIFWENRPLHWGTIAGIMTFIAIMIIMIIKKKKVWSQAR